MLKQTKYTNFYHTLHFNITTIFHFFCWPNRALLIENISKWDQAGDNVAKEAPGGES